MRSKMVSFGGTMIYMIEVTPDKPLIPTREHFDIQKLVAKKKRSQLSHLFFQTRLQMAMKKYFHEDWKSKLTDKDWDEIINKAFTVDKETLKFCESR